MGGKRMKVLNLYAGIGCPKDKDIGTLFEEVAG
jgi:hypothetical protein